MKNKRRVEGTKIFIACMLFLALVAYLTSKTYNY